MKRSWLVAFLAVTAMLSGCAESAIIRSYPVGAKVSVNGVFVGATPAKFVTSRESFEHGTFVAVAEQPGYQTTPATFQRTTCKGRVVGGIFTLGILFLFKSPSCFESPLYIDMPPLAEAAPPGTMSDRLDQLEKLRRDGLITPDEYERQRQRILNSM